MTASTAESLSPDSGETPNVRTVKALYRALIDRDLPGAKRVLVDEPVWDITPGAPDGGVYRGMAEIFGGFYPRLAARFRSFEVRPDSFVDGEDRVVAMGYYRIIENDGDESKFVRFAHIFDITADGRIKGVWQVADTALLDKRT
jgi:ketosteroid isomerase-like protein